MLILTTCPLLGNELYKKKQFKDALEMYDKAGWELDGTLVFFAETFHIIDVMYLIIRLELCIRILIYALYKSRYYIQ